jgi:ribosomal protein S12 methylthiotransferase accessory factor
MEGIETYCYEPRALDLVYGSYSYLSKQYPVIPPDRVFHIPRGEKAKLSEELAWTWAYCVDQDARVLVPAETVFFPFLYADHGIKRHFMCGSNGVASGSTYLEAVTHGLYEVIERYYWGMMEMHSNRLAIDCVRPSDFSEFIEGKLPEETRGSINIVALRLKKGPNIPMAMATYVSDGLASKGYGCAATWGMAVGRAISEAAQVVAIAKSGAREDAFTHTKRFLGKYAKKLEARKPVIFTFFEKTRKQIAAEAKEKSHSTLRAEFDFLVTWLSKHGFNNLCIANLTREGVGVPVVKVFVPSMPPSFALRGEPAEFFATKNIMKYRHGIKR